MSKHKYIDRICCFIIVLAILGTAVFVNLDNNSVKNETDSNQQPYEDKIFATDTVHSIDIIMNEEDWNEFLENATAEEYVSCTLVIDGETYKNVAIRAKGNTSLSSVASYGNNRYSFKVEFDHYTDENTYYGLDKLILNNVIQDNTYMKDYLTYQLMNKMGADAPLCSYTNITVNGEEWGLYLALESVEDSFLTRNYGSNTSGDLYKPDSMSMGGGKGNGKGFEWDDSDSETDNNQAKQMQQPDHNSKITQSADEMQAPQGAGDSRQGFSPPDGQGMPDNQNENSSKSFQDQTKDQGNPGGMGGMGSDDVCLVYSDDEYNSYSNIFDNAKTTVTDADKDRLISSIKQLNQGENLDEVVNVDEVLRYFVVHNFVVNFDSYTGSMIHNYYLYEEDGLLSMIAWDYNLAFGTFSAGDMGGKALGNTDASQSGDTTSDSNATNVSSSTATNTATSMVNFPIDTPVSGGDLDSRPMIAKLLENEEYMNLYHQYFTEFMSNYFENGYVENLINDTAEMIAPYVEKDTTKFCTYDEFESGVKALKEFCSLRAESVKGQLEGTIPATSEGQEDDSNSLIDASSLNLSDMGSMGSGGGQDMKNSKNTSSIQQKSADSTANSTQIAPSMPDITEQSKQNMPDMSNMPSMQNVQNGSQNGTGKASSYSKSNIILLSISVGTMVLAILFIWRFKRRRK